MMPRPSTGSSENYWGLTSRWRSNLIDAVRRAGLEPGRARQILSTNEYEQAVRERQRHYTDMGITSVPSIILNGKYLLQGAQPAEQFERAIRQVAAEA